MYDDRDKVEILLKNYRKIMASAKNQLYIDRPELGLTSVSFIQFLSQRVSYDRTSIQERYVVQKYDVSEETENLMDIAERIRTAVDSLKEQEKQVITNIYFEGRTLKETGEKLGWSRITIWRRKNEALDHLLDVKILSAWEKYKKMADNNE